MTSLKRMLMLGLSAFAITLLTTTSYAETTMEKIAKTGELVIAVQTQGPPVSFIDKNGVRTGFVVDVMQMMANDMGVKLVVRDYDWKGLIPALVSGKVDVLAADMKPTAKRYMQIIFTDPIFYSEMIAYSLKSNGFKSSKDLNKAGISVAVVQGGTSVALAKEYFPLAKHKAYAGGAAQTTQAVQAGRVDAAISGRVTMGQYLSANKNLVILDDPLTRVPLSFSVRPDSVHLLLALNGYMELIREDGRLDKLLKYWWNSNAWEADHK